MKKTLTINLGGIVFHIDEDAYQKLQHYLDSLTKKFLNEPDTNEIISDIEARMSELLVSRLGNKRQVVDMSDIEYLISILGDPEVITNEDETQNKKQFHSTDRKYRRVFRDTESRVLGGVCSGLAAYWNMDPILIRIVFIILVLLGGSGLLIYLILWLIIPEAQTTAQKLEMRGEYVTIDSIKDFIKEEFDQVKENFKKSKK